MFFRRAVAVALALAPPVASVATAQPDALIDAPNNGIHTNEPLFLGVSHRDRDFSLEYTLSLRFDVGLTDRLARYLGCPDQIYLLAFTTQGAQEFSQPSKPVVGKRFHVQIAPMFWMSDCGAYATLSLYGHESNGQSVRTLAEFQDVYCSLSDTGSCCTDSSETGCAPPEELSPEVERYARQRISRGWDLSEVSFGYEFGPEEYPNRVYTKIRWFWHKGILQGEAEESRPLVEDASIRRREVNGVRLAGLWSLPGFCCFDRSVIYGSVESGFDPLPFSKHRSANAAVGLGLGPFEFQFRWGHGYTNDLAEFNRRTTDWAFGLAWRDSKVETN